MTLGFGQTVTTWTDWTSAVNDSAIGVLDVGGSSVGVTVSGCVQGTIVDGSSGIFSDGGLYSLSIVLGDVLKSDHNDVSMPSAFTISFSSSVTDPVFHMAARHHFTKALDNDNAGATIPLEALSGNIAAFAGGSTAPILPGAGQTGDVIGNAGWTNFLNIIAGDVNGYGTTADGTLVMRGTYQNITLVFPNEDNVYFQIGSGVPVPEPSSLILGGLSSLLCLVRRRR